VGYDKKIEIFYTDDEKDRVVVSFEDELVLALENGNTLFEIVTKTKVKDEKSFKTISKKIFCK